MKSVKIIPYWFYFGDKCGTYRVYWDHMDIFSRFGIPSYPKNPVVGTVRGCLEHEMNVRFRGDGS